MCIWDHYFKIHIRKWHTNYSIIKYIFWGKTTGPCSLSKAITYSNFCI